MPLQCAIILKKKIEMPDEDWDKFNSIKVLREQGIEIDMKLVWLIINNIEYLEGDLQWVIR
jgi:hypothetical protein